MPTYDLDFVVPVPDGWTEYIRLNEDGTALWDAGPDFIKAKPYFWRISRTDVLILQGIKNRMRYRVVKINEQQYLCLKVEPTDSLAFLGIARLVNTEG